MLLKITLKGHFLFSQAGKDKGFYLCTNMCAHIYYAHQQTCELKSIR